MSGKTGGKIQYLTNQSRFRGSSRFITLSSKDKGNHGQGFSLRGFVSMNRSNPWPRDPLPGPRIDISR